MKVAIQGVRGSFHHKVAQEFFGRDVEVLECMSFPRLVDALQEGEVDDAVMAIENTIAGAILPNYALLDDHNLTIEGEYYLDIQHNLMALKGQDLSTIKEVWSHPMAILQCRKFFRNYPSIKLVEDTDTAGVAREIKERNLTGIAAIASTTAAEIYDLSIIKSSIQTVDENATRFFILNKNGKEALSTIKREMLVTNRNKPIPELFEKFVNQREHISLVVDEYGSVSGLVTMEDVIETLLGLEIMDESDNVEDLQVLARKNWEHRAKRLGIIEDTSELN